MSIKFTRKTFAYFDNAKANRFDKEWFNQNEELYKEHVKEPFQFLINAININIGDKLDIINDQSYKSISRPLRPKNKANEKGFVKDFISTDIAEKKTSIFEWNPGIHIQIGANKNDNVIGGGLYMVSGRQIKALRASLHGDYQTISKLLSASNFKKSWSNITGEKYKRFPKDYNPEDLSAEYIWYKQFYFSQTLKRSEVIKNDFTNKVVEDLNNCVEVLNWIRKSVGKYKK